MDRASHAVAALGQRRDAVLRNAVPAPDSPRIRAQRGSAHRPTHAPVADAAHGTADGEVWMRLWSAEPDTPQRFVVLDRDAQPAARVTVPAGLDVQHVGRDFVLGVRRDSLGVESVHEHRVTPP